MAYTIIGFLYECNLNVAKVHAINKQYKNVIASFKFNTIRYELPRISLLEILRNDTELAPSFFPADEEDALFKGINNYRTSLSLSALASNENAECLADGVAEQFKNQPCTNTTGSNTVLGTEPNFPNYPKILAKCHLNLSNTRDGIVLPACVPKLDPTLVLTNFTKSQYSDYLNDSKFTGAGIGSENDWIVAVLTTSTPEGSFVPATNDNVGVSAASFLNIHAVYHFLVLLMASILLL